MLARCQLFGLACMAAVIAAMLLADTGALAGDSPAPVLSVSAPRPRVSSVIFPAQDIPLRFSHVQHLSAIPGDPLDCTTCHDTAADSRSSLDRLIPGEHICAMCHDIDRAQIDKQVPAGEPPAACGACHVGVQATAVPGRPHIARVQIPSPNIKFDHALHVTTENIACSQCHGDFVAERVGLADRDQLPSMTVCLGCHEREARARRKPMLDDCTTCHLADAGGVVKTEYPSGTLAPSGQFFGADHDALFRVSHAAAAQNNSDYCGACHKQSFCVDCHDGAAKPMDFHGNDYVLLHAMDARRATLDCDACHRSQTFCTGCHSRSGVSSDPGGGSEYAREPAARRFHPDGWAAMGLRGQDHHSFQAQRNIKQCAACHREQFCVGCHGNTMDTLQINPHPAGWAQSRRCKTLYASAGRMCLRCHVDLEEARCGM